MYDLVWNREWTPAIHGIRGELDWFNANLPVPKRLGVSSKGRWYRDGVCWFQDSARDDLEEISAAIRKTSDDLTAMQMQRVKDNFELLIETRKIVATSSDTHIPIPGASRTE